MRTGHLYKRSDSIRVWNCNIRSLHSKREYFKAELDNAVQKPLIICSTEIWSSDNIANAEIAFDGYECCRLDGNLHGGGISIYVSQSAITAKSVNINVQLCEMICIDCAFMICSNKKPQPLQCIAYYRPPKKGQI